VFDVADAEGIAELVASVAANVDRLVGARKAPEVGIWAVVATGADVTDGVVEVGVKEDAAAEDVDEMVEKEDGTTDEGISVEPSVSIVGEMA